MWLWGHSLKEWNGCEDGGIVCPIQPDPCRTADVLFKSNASDHRFQLDRLGALGGFTRGRAEPRLSLGRAFDQIALLRNALEKRGSKDLILMAVRTTARMRQILALVEATLGRQFVHNGNPIER